jgi:endonuclease/exonuclease/phosphatase (EEP) superfamily protein YafD
MKPTAMFSFTLLAGGTVLAFAPDAYLTMLARAFMFQWTIAFALLTIALVWRGHFILAACSLACMVMAAMQLEQPMLADHRAEATPDLRVMHMNVYQPNQRHAEIIEQALASDADIISVQEVSPEWEHALREGLSEAYPYSLAEPRRNCYGIALFSRSPLDGWELAEMHGSPFIEARATVNGHPFRLISVHATSPTSYGHFRRRNAQLRELADRLNNDSITTIVVGDMNAVHWDKAYRRFHQSTGLRVVTGTGLRTWPSWGPMALIPLDHVFISRELSVAGVQRFKIPGSDHKGLIADIVFPDAL